MQEEVLRTWLTRASVLEQDGDDRQHALVGSILLGEVWEALQVEHVMASIVRVGICHCILGHQWYLEILSHFMLCFHSPLLPITRFLLSVAGQMKILRLLAVNRKLRIFR